MCPMIWLHHTHTPTQSQVHRVTWQWRATLSNVDAFVSSDTIYLCAFKSKHIGNNNNKQEKHQIETIMFIRKMDSLNRSPAISQ